VFGWLVAKIRGPFVRKNYRLIGGGSPILEITRHQVRALEGAIGDRVADVAVAMRYTRPDTYDAVRELVRSGVDRLVLLPLYPQYSAATTGSSESELRRVMTELGIDLPLEVIRTWHDHPAYLDVQAALVSEAIERLPESERDGVVVLFSAHGLPQRVADRGDPYPEETAATVAGVVQRLAYRVDARIGYQSRTRPVRWIGPGTDQVLRDLGAEGVTTVVVVPISFVSDHIETLYETDMLFRDIAEQAGIRRYIRADVMNDRPEVGPMLASILEDSL
ncbi:MAG: ferrochelatase, partial [Gammaproteobacteria bacterium]|nr:ferrochelatase [Gammaproteobacteria bacterium]